MSAAEWNDPDAQLREIDPPALGQGLDRDLIAHAFDDDKRAIRSRHHRGHDTSTVVSDAMIHVALPQLLGDEPPEVVSRYATRAEELGFAGLWSLEAVPGSATSRVPVLDGLHLLTTAATATSSIRLGIAVIVLPARNAVQLAKELATIDRLSGGRLTVAVGVGRKEPTAAGLGLPTGHRAQRVEEGVEVLRALWADGDATFQGEQYSFTGLRIEPKPLQRPGPPIWFGAGSPPALRRAARIGDGWLAAGSSASAQFAGNLSIVEDALREFGRDPDEFAVGKRIYIAVEDTEQRARERLTPILDGMYDSPGLTERVAVCGTAEACAEQVRELVAAGARELLLHPMYDFMEQLDRLAELSALVAQ
jgi:probable F420-dependent oxidoreductase